MPHAMRPFILLAAPAAAIVLAGCGASPTWTRVRAVHVDTRDAADPFAAYAGQVSASLRAAGVQHKVVTYQFRYRTELREEAIATRTAVIYRDGNDPKNPWWLAEDRLRAPVWLPGNDLNRQLSFHVRRPAEVLSVEEGDGKGVIESEDDSVQIARRSSAPERGATPGWFQRLFARHTQPAPRAIEVVPPRLSPARTVPTDSTPDTSALALFRARHGTAFDPASITDRLKMEALLSRRSARLD
jgi:hypothetical protein